MKRFFYHPESDSLFATEGEDPGTDGLVEELDAPEYAALLARQQEDEALS